MAKARIYRLTLTAQTDAMALRLTRQILYEIEFLAKLRTLGGPYSTGNLSLSIHTTGPTLVPNGVMGRVGTDKSYAAAVHGGSRVHWIFPKAARGAIRFGSRRRPQLRFFWRKVGRVVYMPHVPGSPGKVGRSHPGQEPNPFLASSIQDVARRHNMRYVVYEI